MSNSTSTTRAAAKSTTHRYPTAADLPPLPASAVHDDLDTPALFVGQLAKDWDVLVHDHDRASFPAASLAHPDTQQPARRPSLASLNVDSARLAPSTVPPKSPASTSPLASPALRPTLATMPHGPTSTPVGALREVARASAHVPAPTTPAVAGPVVCADCGASAVTKTELVVPPPAPAPAPVSPPLIATAAAAVVDKCVACIEAVAHGVQREAASKRPMVAFRH
ncbi:hypothetical protein GGF31_004695 [Allomyces arbusculus]|nr:hypothetical protein GGF31_004695 [Allomyces arbusculus]